MVLTLGELPAKGYASHGESWSFALGLKLAAYQLLRHDLGEDPVLVLDDVFAELDTGRRERLAAMIGDCEQVLVTAAVGADVPACTERTDVCREPGRGAADVSDEPREPADPEPSLEDRVDDAAAAALARARAAAKAKGLRPGLKPLRRRRPGMPEGPRSRDGRDPLLLGDQMDRLLVDRGWRSTWPWAR